METAVERACRAARALEAAAAAAAAAFAYSTTTTQELCLYCFQGKRESHCSKKIHLSTNDNKEPQDEEHSSSGSISAQNDSISAEVKMSQSHIIYAIENLKISSMK